jgi:hypothetical protein
LRRSILACGLLLAFAGLGTTAAVGATRTATHRTTAHRKAVAFYSHAVRKLRAETWYWQRVMGVRRSHVLSRSLSSVSLARLRHLAAVWNRREKRAHRHARHPPNFGAWMCIHHYEGAWNDRGGPYYGGLQMSISFQRDYGGWLLRRKGTADHWTPLEQIWAAVRAARSQGFYPWPNTARYCGLI